MVDKIQPYTWDLSLTHPLLFIRPGQRSGSQQATEVRDIYM